MLYISGKNISFRSFSARRETPKTIKILPDKPIPITMGRIPNFSQNRVLGSGSRTAKIAGLPEPVNSQNGR